jgi:oligopeptidase B
VARRVPKVLTLHGKERTDDYAWLREKGSKEVLDYLAAENAYTDAMIAPSAPLREALYKEMLGRIQQNDASVPYEKGDFLYYQRTEEGKQYPTSYRKPKGGKGAEQIILDPNEIGKANKFVSVAYSEVSDDGNYLAYGLDTVGFRQYTLQIKDLRTGEILAEHPERIRSIAFAGDGKTLFYTVEDPVQKRSYRLYRHEYGKKKGSAAASGEDPLVYEEKDERFDLEVERSHSKEYVFLTAQSHTTTEVSFLSAKKPESKLTVVAPREQGHEYYVQHRGGDFYIRTNAGAPNFHLVKAPVKSPGRASWKEVVPHSDEALLHNFGLFSGFTVLVVRRDGQRGISILDAKDHVLVDSVALPDPVREVYMSDNERFDAPFVRLGYESPVTPESTYDYDVGKRELVLRKRTEIKGYDPSRYQVVRTSAKAKDGTMVPMSILARKDITPDGKSPAVLYGYGAYGLSIRSTFSAERFSLVDRGVVYAFAHVRGGMEMGRRWYDAGRMANKRNSFTDFIACGEHLATSGWADRSRIVAEGRSAGGLLVGAAMNMRPDLWRGVVLGVPFVDVVNTMLDTSLPLTAAEFEEWGDPRKPEQYDAIMAYSPYDNIRPQAYPALLVYTSYHDSQVMYWEPAKFVARLRATKTDHNPLLFRVDMDPSGHGGKSGRYDRLKEAAFRYSFILTTLGIDR